MSVLVLGMHRSGTSAVTGALRYIGLRLPEEEHLLPPHPDNPRGYFENRVLLELNDRILTALDGDWSAPPSLPDGWTELSEIQGLREEAERTFRATMPAEAWVWKDPRNCLTLPFWLSLLDGRPAVVLVHRPPWEIARSLRARDDFTLSLGIALWERYTRQLLTNITGLRVAVVGFPSLLEEPVASMRRLRDDLAELGVPVGPLDEDAVAEFLSPSVPSAATEPEKELLSPRQEALRERVRSLDHRYGAFQVELPPPTAWGEAILEERRRHLLELRRHRDERQRLVEDRDRLLEERNTLREVRKDVHEKQARWADERRRFVDRRKQVLRRVGELERRAAFWEARYREEIESLPRWLRSLLGWWRRLRRRDDVHDSD